MRNLLPKLILAIVAPAALFVAAEGFLRWFNVGYPTSFLRPAVHQGDAVWVNNPFYGYRFFPRRAARNPAPLLLPQQKPDGVIRIAVVGESAAMGDPAIEFSLARGLDKMLNEPGRPLRFEVINAAMTAINSHVIVDITRELRRRDVDVMVIYMGNNEVVGPFGPGTAITRGEWGEVLTPWRVALTRLRLAGVVRGAAQAFGKSERTETWIGMEMFENNRIPRDDPRLQAVYRSFEKNLRTMIHEARRGNIEVVLCTMAVNISDCAPFGSANRTDIVREDLRAWNASYREGRQAYADGRFAEALPHYEQALRLDDTHAELRYRMGHLLLKLDRADEAREHLLAARDLDLQRFRADGAINRVIRRVAGEESVMLADVESAFGWIRGHELFVDHVHFSMPGLYVLCREIKQTLDRKFSNIPIVPEEEFRDRLLITPWSERKAAALMNQRRDRPPFTTQWGNREQREQLQQRIADLSARIAGIDTRDVETQVALLQAHYPWDFYYDQQWAHILTVENRWDEAAPVWDRLMNRLAGYSDWHAVAALAFARTGDPERAARLLSAAGPPFGHYLAESAKLVFESLRHEQRDADARTFAAALLKNTGRFEDRKAVESWVK